MIKAIETTRLLRGTNIREEHDKELMELVESIRQNGLLNPITVVRKGDKYVVVAGHRRFLAMQLLREPFVDCNILDHTPDKKELLCIQLQENCCRKNMSAWELVDLFESLRKEGMNQREIAAMCGKSQCWVSIQYAAERTLTENGNVTKETKKWSATKIEKEYGGFVRVERPNTRQAVVCFQLRPGSSKYNLVIRDAEARKEFNAWMKEFKKKWQS